MTTDLSEMQHMQHQHTDHQHTPGLLLSPLKFDTTDEGLQAYSVVDSEQKWKYK